MCNIYSFIVVSGRPHPVGNEEINTKAQTENNRTTCTRGKGNAYVRPVPRGTRRRKGNTHAKHKKLYRNRGARHWDIYVEA